MARITGPQNPVLVSLVSELKKKAQQENVPLFKRIASDLERSARNKRAVNLSRINRYTQAGEFVVVPGKVLGSGELKHKLTISAFQFSSGAEEKIRQAGSSIMPLHELIKQKSKGKKIRIIG